MDILPLALITLLAALVQATTGSGLALIAMPVLVHLLDPVPAAALVAVMALTTQLIMVARYRRAMHLGALWRPVVGSLLGIPVGVLALSRLDERLILIILGLVLIAYSAYGLLRLRLPRLADSRWAYGFGLASGVLHGAYNTGGPPYVIYGMCSRWPPQQFKANVQALLMVNSVSVIVAHLIAGHFNQEVLRNYLYAAPMIVVGVLAGFWLDRYIDAALFQKLVLALLLVIGIRMVIPL